MLARRPEIDFEDEGFTAVRSAPDRAPSLLSGAKGDDGERTHTLPHDFPGLREPDVHVEVRATSRWEPPEQRAVYDVLTRNCAYRLNCRLDCVQVIDLWTGRPIDAHPLLGAWLAGGRTNDEDGEELSYPLPAVGAKAVFQLPSSGRMALTSTVERVTMIGHRYRPAQVRAARGVAGAFDLRSPRPSAN